ncbi:hypothetical protein NQ315_012197 [Exocentrus adspersus]|uniref:Uncharacterized protein n=1 Tax=Exocentrus adspersus TaxID=1586481 RepID=A0AAV8VY54_9CUCU|nr:hypothetical protein NQ315_012197 [Exocentrus adspersus]
MIYCNSAVLIKKYSYVLQERDVVRTLDFSGKFEAHKVDLCKHITTDVNHTFVKVLNINYLYWIGAPDLRSLIKKLEHLETLYALDTKLGIKDRDIAEYAKLKKLAVSIEDKQFEHSSVVAAKALTALKSLCLKFTQYIAEDRIYFFLRQIKQLEEVWISDEAEHTYRINYGQIAVSLKNLKKFVIKSKSVLPYYDFSYTGLIKVFDCKRSECATEFVFEKILTKTEGTKPSIFEPAENEYERSWQIFQNLHKGVPYGPKESQVIHLTKSLKDVYFEDLNFCHTVILCNIKLIQAALQILSFKNSSKLKRLSFRSCLFQNADYTTKEKPTSGFKRWRKGVQINSACHPFETTANNLKSLRELEILTCPGCATGAVVSAYPLIATFEYLETLTIEVPLLLDGSFLKEVFIKCRYLESLYIFCKSQNEKFIMNLCQNLKYSQNLRHFRLDHKEVLISKLLNSFNELKYRKLLRIYVNCDKLRGVDASDDPFSVFLERNPQLIFCLFQIKNNTNKQNRDIHTIFNKYKCGDPAKMFFVIKEISSFSGGFPIPAAHHDIVFYRTNVAVVNIDEF